MKKFLLIALVGLLTSCGFVSNPTEEPTDLPTETPTVEPTETPTETPTEEPTEVPTVDPTEDPTETPTEQPTEIPTETPTETPTEEPTLPPGPVLNEVSGSEALNYLKNSPYKSNIKTTADMGIKEIHNVGVDYERFENEKNLYPIPTEGNVYLAEDIGITQDGENNSGTFSIWLANNKNVPGNKIIKFKDGVYPFSSKVDVTGISDLYIVGTGKTEFLYSGFGTYFEANNAKNLQIHGISFDKKYSPTISGTITHVDEFTGSTIVTLSIPEEFDLSNEIYGMPEGGCSYMECSYDEATGKYVPDNEKNLVYNSPTSASNRGITNYLYDHSSRTLKLTLNQNFPYDNYVRPTIGTVVSFAYTMYEAHGLAFNYCEDTVLEDINVYVSGGMGLRFNEGKNAYINNVNYRQREGSNRIMTCTADIIHTCALEGELIITNCLLESSHDDALNIKSFYTKVTSVTAAAREIVVSQTQNEATIKFEKGDTIEVYNTETYEIVDTYTVNEVVKSGTSFTLTVDKRPRNVEVGFNVGNVTKATRMTLENCVIRNKRNRGILLQGRESSIINCTFQNVIMGAVQVLSVYDSFREAIMPESITITNTKFLNCEGGDVSVFTYGSKGGNHTVPNTIKNVVITENFFTNGKGTPVNLLGTGTVNASNNLFHYIDKNTSKIFEVKASSDVTVENNVLISKHAIDMVIQGDNVSGLTLNNNVRREEP